MLCNKKSGGTEHESIYGQGFSAEHTDSTEAVS